MCQNLLSYKYSTIFDFKIQKNVKAYIVSSTYNYRFLQQGTVDYQQSREYVYYVKEQYWMIECIYFI